MSGVDLIGEIEPWPSSRASLPDGWSWGDNPQIAQVQAHKSRLILQADALANLLAPDAEDRTLMHALYHGAAEWVSGCSRTTSTRRPRRSSSVRTPPSRSLSCRATSPSSRGVLAQWRAVGPTHARFYRDGGDGSTHRARSSIGGTANCTRPSMRSSIGMIRARDAASERDGAPRARRMAR